MFSFDSEADLLLSISQFVCMPQPQPYIYVSLQFRAIQYYVNFTVRHRTTSYEDTSCILMLPLYSWWNSIPFLPKTKLWGSNINDFRSIYKEKKNNCQIFELSVFNQKNKSSTFENIKNQKLSNSQQINSKTNFRFFMIKLYFCNFPSITNKY